MGAKQSVPPSSGSDSAKNTEEGQALVSQEQQVKRSQTARTYELSASKLYTLLVTILVLFGLLVTSATRDWTIYRGEEERLKGVVDREDLITHDVPKQGEGESITVNLFVNGKDGDLGVAVGKGRKKSGKRATTESKTDGGSSKSSGSTTVGKKESSSASGGKQSKQTPKQTPKKTPKKTKKIPKVPKKPAKPAKQSESTGKGKSKGTAGADAANNPKKAKKAKLSYEEGRQKALDDYHLKLPLHLKKMQPRNVTLTPRIKTILDNYDGSLKPPLYCYKTPTGASAHPREPDADDLKNANLPLDVSKKILYYGAADYPCLFLTQECMDVLPGENSATNRVHERLYTDYDRLYFSTKHSMGKGSPPTEKDSTLSRAEKIAKLPSRKDLHFGTCAVVGNADNMLEGKYGKEIDSHDFVARFNTVIGPFSEAVGTKTDGMFAKPNYRSTQYRTDTTPSKYNMFPKYVPFELDPTHLPGGKPPLIYGVYELGVWRADLEKFFFAFLEAKNLTGDLSSFGVPKIHHTSGGITRLRAMIQMLRSGMCSRLDIYGFSADGGGKYFEPRKKVSTAHVINGENYYYRLMMATGVHGKLCVYGK